MSRVFYVLAGFAFGAGSTQLHTNAAWVWLLIFGAIIAFVGAVWFERSSIWSFRHGK